MSCRSWDRDSGVSFQQPCTPADAGIPGREGWHCSTRGSRTYDIVQEVRLAGCHALAAIHVHVRHMHMQVVVCVTRAPLLYTLQQGQHKQSLHG